MAIKKKYDLAISFAGEQREIARYFAERLDASGYSVFYDEFRNLWGTDLTIELGNAYQNEARHCLILLSEEYIRKPYTKLESRNALTRFMDSPSNYLLVMKIDDVDLPGLPKIIAHITRQHYTDDEIYLKLLEVLGPPDHEYTSLLDENDKNLSLAIINACRRRAIFSSMKSEIGLEAMYTSIQQAIGELQILSRDAISPSLQFRLLEILRYLDEIERTKLEIHVGVSNHLPPEIAYLLDERKRGVIRVLLEIRRAADLSIQLPLSLGYIHFFDVRQANASPTQSELNT